MKKNSLKKSLINSVILMLACLGLFYTIQLVSTSVQAKEEADVDDYQALKEFADVIAIVRKNYVEEVEISKLVDGAIKGMLISLDPHSSYLGNDNYKELQVETKGEFGGLGIEISVKDGLLTVVSPIEDSPAARAGIRAGDKIIKIESEFARDMTLNEAVKKMRGLKGTSVTLSVARGESDKLIPVKVIRDVIKVKSVRHRTLDNGYGYVRLAQFQDSSSKEFGEAIEKLNEKAKKSFPDTGLKGLIIDLRYNPGGLLTEAIRVSDLFLKSGVIVYTDGRLESQKQKYFAHDSKNEPTYPIIILVNEGSASASEIVAGALQDHGRALILGQKTFGKGSVQTILPMDGGSALRLTTALYYTKSGRSIQAKGITPDVIISNKLVSNKEEESAESNVLVRREKDLPGAIKNPNSNEKENANESDSEEFDDSDRIRIGSREAMKAELKELLASDPQLDEALRLLKTWNIFQDKPVPEDKVDQTA